MMDRIHGACIGHSILISIAGRSVALIFSIVDLYIQLKHFSKRVEFIYASIEFVFFASVEIIFFACM
jgi:hypothetical protein